MSQDNTITLSVDAANDGNPANLDYARLREELNKTTYMTSDHADAARDIMQLYRTDPKRSGQSLGIRKSAVKFTVDQSVANADGSGNITLPLIVEVSFAVPVGTPTAEVVEAAQTALAVLDDDDILLTLTTLGEI